MRRVAALLAIAVAACTLAPRYERPASPVANRFDGTGGTAVDAVGWRDVFGDPRLQEVIALALRNNRDVRVAALNVELARAQYRIERAPLVPSVSGVAGADVTGTSDDVSVQYRVGVSAAYELDLVGRVRSLRAAALEEYLATEEAQRAAQLSLVAEVVSQYLRERAFEEQRQLAEQTLAAVRESQQMTARLLEAGQRSELDVRTAEAQVQGARAELARVTRLRAQAHNALVLLVGAELPSSLPTGQPLDATTIVADLSPGLPSELLERRPDILAAEHALRGANANIGAARAAFFPSISLTGFAGLASKALSSLFTGGAAVWTFSPQLTVPLFTGGRNTATLEVAKVRARIEVARYEQAIQVAFREVADALVARASLDEQLAAQTARASAEQKRFEISQQRYQAGVESYLTVLAAQQDLYQAQQQLIDVRLARLLNLADLYRALGGGWREHGARQSTM
ncbi:MAG TPA: efflux transporter outer membrane subunit [Kofleriaceae bacterium]|nr:efflux transporter outer membrane subunit [Kofleriaceae bacterium]